MSLQKINIFSLKGLSAVMDRLAMNVIGDPIEMRMRHGKCAKAFLPGKPAADPLLLVDMIRRSGFNVTDQIRGSDAGFQTEQDMCVIGHAIDCD